jgi:hypothetical protein
MGSFIKYSILVYIILAFLMFYEISQAITTKNVLEKKVHGVSTQIKEIEAYQEEISSFTNDY